MDIVTEVDQAVEKMVSSRLSKAYPEFSFMGEETYKPGTKLGPEPTFVVDPIDGELLSFHLASPHLQHFSPVFSMHNECHQKSTMYTNSYPRNHKLRPFLPQRLHLSRRRHQPRARHRRHLQPLSRPPLHSHKVPRRLHDPHQGSTPQKLPLASSPRPLEGLANALVAIEWGSNRDGPNYELKTEVFKKLAATKETGGAMVHSLRSLGSAALNIAAVAAGQMDAYWEGGCWAWDVCAGWCILKEAGGIMAGGNPGQWDPAVDERKYLAVRGAPSGQKELVEEFWGVIGNGTMDYSV